MAAKPGPIVALAALAALFFMGKKGKVKSPEDVANLPEGTELEDPAPEGSPVGSGGTKRPKGQGTGGGDWEIPTSTGLASVWLSPQCDVVVEPTVWFDNLFLPILEDSYRAMMEVRQAAAQAKGIALTKPDIYTNIALALGLVEVNMEGEPRISTGPHMDEVPFACLAWCPLWYVGTTYNQMKTEDDRIRFSDDIVDWADLYPALYGWLYDLIDRVKQIDEFATLPLVLPPPEVQIIPIGLQGTQARIFAPQF